MPKFSVINQDITKLNVEAIVNASNVSGLGCTIPNHCIDSAIHLAAGPKFYEECVKLKGIPIGEAKITLAYNLPCKYIIHTTGPQIQKNQTCDYKMLAQCYTNVLNLAKIKKIKQLAFCCISTGIFGFPKNESAKIAIETARNFPYNCFNEIIFCTYTFEDEMIYNDLLGL